MLELPERITYYKIIQTGRLAERLGADFLGLGAFTSVVGDGGITVAKSLDVPVTTGDAYTVSVAVQAIRVAAAELNIPIKRATAAVVGATGTIGRVCAELLANDVAELYLIGKTPEKLQRLQKQMSSQTKTRLNATTDVRDINKAQLVITVSSATHAIIQPEYLRPGSVICDVARPRDVSAKVAAVRDDVLVIDGGMVNVPGPAEFNFDFGFPLGKAYACMAETMALVLEGQFEDYTLGKDISCQRVNEITTIATKHGFHISGFRSFERPVTQEQIEKARKFSEQKNNEQND
jgi:predicted amino acid dehydrogenase